MTKSRPAQTQTPNLLQDSLSAWACLPTRCLAGMAEVGVIQAEYIGRAAALAVGPWTLHAGGKPLDVSSPIAALAERSAFDLAFWLGARGEERPFPE